MSIRLLLTGLIFSILGSALFFRCANQMSPTGGPRDSIPPRMIQAIPANKSIEVKTNDFTFYFNERISADKIKSQLMITPRIDLEYDYKVRKNMLTLSFEGNFTDSTTYTLNFREGLVDITESNPTPDNTYVFSTGDYIDSIRISGYAFYLLAGDTAKNVTVGLYRTQDTVNILNGSPYYFTTTNDKGFFQIDNIRNGAYTLYAFRDNNKNLKLESNSEAFALIGDTLQLNDNMDGLELNLINLDVRDLRMQSSSPSGPYFQANYNKYITRYDLNLADTTHKVFSGLTADHRAVRFYNYNFRTDSTMAIITAYDSIDLSTTDTVFVKFRESTRRKDDFTYTVKPPAASPIESLFKAEIDLNKPIITINPDSIFFVFDTIAIAFFNADTSIIKGKTDNIFQLQTSIDRALADTLLATRMRMEQFRADSLRKAMTSPQEGRVAGQPEVRRQAGDRSTSEIPRTNKGPALFLGKGAFISADLDSSRAYYTGYEFFKPENFAVLSGSIVTEHSCYFVQLIDNSKKVIFETYSKPDYRFDKIPPGRYRIRFIIDRNCDGKWNPGNLKTHEEPEPILFFPEEIVMRANWEMNQDLSF
jgi:uncharacterized protein (DUF2141 family)